MRKAALHFAFLAVAFFGTWFLLSRIDYTGIFGVEELSRENERKLGEIFVASVRASERVVEDDSVQRFVGAIAKRLCDANGIPDTSVSLIVTADEDVNAFALPGRHLVINTDLIEYCGNAEELSGVMAHEIAHMELHHVMKKMMKEVGLTMVGALAGGEAGNEIVRESIRYLSSTAFDREQERAADALSVRYLAAAGIDPQHSADFLFRLSREKFDVPKRFELLSTHPNSSDRAAEIISLRKTETITPRPVTTAALWSRFQEHVRKAAEDERTSDDQ